MKPYIALSLLTLIGTLCGCATPTPYQSVANQSASTYGYKEQRIEETRFRLSFSGNSLTSRETVETYLLYRAAELTLEKGYDYFTIVTRKTDEDKRVREVYDDPYLPFSSLSWRYYGRSGWGGWGMGFSSQTMTYTRFEAMAEIVIYKGKKPEGDATAYDARDVKKNLEAKILRPTKPN